MKMTTMLIAFTGKGHQIGHAEGFVASAANGVILKVDAAGVENASLSVPCKEARFETVVLDRDKRTFESGRVFFPDIDSYLDVFTPEMGLFFSVEGGNDVGTVGWHIRGGGGIFAGAKGVVTGNAVIYPDGTFLDHQLYRVVTP